MNEHQAPRVRIKVQWSGSTIGPGKIALLEAVASTGSISAAARHMGMNYRRAWHLLNTLQEAFVEPLLATETGGKGKGGASLTPLAQQLVALYRQAEQGAFDQSVDLRAFLLELPARTRKDQ